MHPFVRFACLSFLLAACEEESQPINRYGTVLLQSDSTPEAKRAASAFFYVYDAAQDVGDCGVISQSLQCNIWSCSDTLYTAPGAFPPVSVGDLSVTGTMEDLTFTEGEVGDYSAEIPFEGPLWAEDALVTAHVSGSADFPQAEVGVHVPRPVTVTEPEPVDGMLVIDPAADLSVSWSAPSQGPVYAAISTVTKTVDDKTILLPGIDCLFEGAAGSGIIPKAVIALAPRPQALVEYRFDVLTFAAARGRSGDAALTARATTFGLSTSASISFE